jgi:chromosome segregation and condensation protein ScpB
MFATTPEFLDYFGLESLSQLPELPQIKEPKNLDLALDETTDSKETTIPPKSIN